MSGSPSHTHETSFSGTNTQDLRVCTTTTSASAVPVAESATAIPQQNEPREPSHGAGKNNGPVSTKFDAKKSATAGRADRSVSVGTAASKPPTIPAFLNDESHKYIPISGCKLPPGASYPKLAVEPESNDKEDGSRGDGEGSCTCCMCGGHTGPLKWVELPTHITCFPELTNSLKSDLYTKSNATLSHKCSVLLRFMREAHPVEVAQILHFLKNKEVFIFFTPPVPTKTIMSELFKQDFIDVMICILEKADSYPIIVDFIFELMLTEPKKVVQSCPLHSLLYPSFLAAVGDRKIICAAVLGRFGILLSTLLHADPPAAKDPEVSTIIERAVATVLRLLNRESESLPVSVIEDLMCMLSNASDLCLHFQSDTRIQMEQRARLLYLHPEMNLCIKVGATKILANCFRCLQPQHLTTLSAEESSLLDPNFVQSLALFSLREFTSNNVAVFELLPVLDTLESVPGVVEFLARYWSEKPSRMIKFLSKGNPLTLQMMLGLALEPARNNNAELMRIWNQFEEKRSRSQSKGLIQAKRILGMGTKLRHEGITGVIQTVVGSKEELTEEEAENLATAQAEAHVERPLPHCTVCKKPTTKQCGVCGKVRYCSKTCQRQDWPAHKLICYRGREDTDKAIPPQTKP
ncbi:hypothetical protein Pelo_9204 [Pelomyxa schiedti]|nr:hypothetical protein Pelo_9204 [Pelomyxa schiedti]